MNRYNPAEIEPKWQASWKKSGIHDAIDFDPRPKYVMLTEFPYPSGDGLHLGHTREYTLGDILARYKRMKGYNVLYPMGYDAFGLPAENYAIKHKIRPQDATDKNIKNFRKQFDKLGFSFDWDRSFRTTDPDYYRWTQWLFLKFYEHDMAYQADIAINWCPKCKTGLANEEAVGGVHERCDTPVEKKQLRQWMLRITKYADRLIDGLSEVDYPPRIADQQVNWIGRSVGAEIDFEIAGQASASLAAPAIDNESRIMNHESGGESQLNDEWGMRNDVKDSLKFTPELTKRILDGKKTSTIRLEAKKLEAGDIAEFMTRDGEKVTPFGFAKITDVHTMKLGDIPNDLKGHETFVTDEEKLAAYKSYYGEKVSFDTEFTIYDFNFIHHSSFIIPDSDRSAIRVFTTRADTIYGVTFMVLAPEHPLVATLTTEEQREQVDGYIKQAQAKSDVERQETDREKTGVFTGGYAINPMTHERVPVWIADYVLMGYGTGAIMAVPAHDERDYAFARKFDLPVTQVVAQTFNEPLPNAKRITGVNIIGYDPETKRFMSMHNNRANKPWLAGGGKNDDETYEEAARRELTEEAGYQNIAALIPLGGFFFTYFYNRNKDSNRCGTGHNYLAIISEKETPQPQNESHEDYTPVWSSYDEMVKKFESFGEGSAHWMDAIRQAVLAAAAYNRGEQYEAVLFSGDGTLVNSGPFNDTSSAEARDLIVQHLAREGRGAEKVNYRLRDWIFSRQHYWGEPIPIIHCDDCGAVPVPEKDLPVTLPDVDNYEPTDTGESPLAAIESWVNVECPKCKKPAKRETDTMPNWAGSSWYYLRYFDAKNHKAFADPKKLEYWGMVDLYLGGMEHTTLHLLYSRFWHQFFHNIGLVPTREPYAARRGQGIILAEDGSKMSKSKGNVVNPDEVIDSGYGADALRLCIAFLAPYDMTTPWNSKGVAGTYRYLNRLWTLTHEFMESTDTAKDDRGERILMQVAHIATQKITDDLENMNFNTTVATLMEAMNTLYKLKASHGFGARKAWKQTLTTLIQLTAPYAPHITDELWQLIGYEGSVHTSAWPTYDPSQLLRDTMKIAIQINGKVRGDMELARDMAERDIEMCALSHENVKNYLAGRMPRRVIYVPGRIVNIVV